MAEDNTPQLPSPHPALQRLDRLVGTWRTEGHLASSDEITINGETTFRWLPGGFFLEQHNVMSFMGLEIDSLELIYDAETATFPSTVFSNLAPTAPYRWEVEGDVLKISVSYGTSLPTARASPADGAPTRAPTRPSTSPTTSPAAA